jgi:hypothetical protein
MCRALLFVQVAWVTEYGWGEKSERVTIKSLKNGPDEIPIDFLGIRSLTAASFNSIHPPSSPLASEPGTDWDGA